MIITKLGNHFIKLQSGDTVIAVNPVSKDSKEKSSKFGANVALVSLNHPDMNGASDMSFGEKAPFIISGPGEYEVKGIFVKGFASHSHYAAKKESDEKLNTVYFMNMDNMSICILGAMSDEKLSEEALESVEEVDILFIPVSKDTLPAALAYKIAVSLEPKMIIPLGDPDEVKTFIKEAGADKPEKMEKLTLKKKDLDGKEGEIVLLDN